MADASDIISDPSIALLGVPRAPIDANPFTAGQRFAIGNDREREAQAFLQNLAGNNQLRALMQQRLNAHEQQLERLKQLEQLRLTLGPAGAAGAAGLPVTGFATASTPVAFAQSQADAQKTASEATLAGAQAGPTPLQSPVFSAVTGFEVEERVPTGVQKSQAAAKVPKAKGFLPSGIGFERPLTEQELAQTIQKGQGLSITGQGMSVDPTGSEGRVPTPQQSAKLDDLLVKLEQGFPGKSYRAVVRADGVAVVIETDDVTGEEIEVQKFDTGGKSVSE